MKKTLLYCMLVVVVFGFNACKAKVDLDNIDTKAQVNTQLGLPIGDISANMGDFLGDSTTSKYIRIYDGKGAYNQLMNEGTLYFRDTFHITKNYHPIDLASRISDVTKDLEVPAGTYPAAMMPYTLPDFPLSLHLNGFNNDTTSERVDSMYVSKASFVSTIDVENLGLQASDISAVQVLLPEEFIDRNGVHIEKLDVPFSEYGFGAEIPIELSDFTLCLMKDKTKKPANTNVVDSLHFKVRITLNTGEDLIVGSNAAFNYNFKVKIIEFDAMWGFFEPSNEMSGKDSVRMDSLLSFWDNFERLHLPIAHPQIDFVAAHSIVAPLRTHVNYIYFEEDNNPSSRVYATFNNKHEYDWVMEYMPEGLNAPLDARCIDAGNFWLNHLQDHGHIDQIFTIRPDRAHYSFDIAVNNNYSDKKALEQFRITKNTQLNVAAITTLPFVFNEGLDLVYHDTIDSINITKYQLDSIVASTEWIDTIDAASVKLYLNAENWLPFDVDARLRFLDKDGQEIDFSYEQNGNMTDSLHIPGPTQFAQYGEYYHVTQPGTFTLIISVNKSEWDRLMQMKQIDLRASLGKNTCMVSLLDSSKLKIRVGLAASVKAVFDLQGDNK